MGEGMANKQWIKEVLIENADKNFVERLFKKDAPMMDIGEGRVVTHQMSWGHTGIPGDEKTKIIVYPNVVLNKQTKGLEWLDGREAIEHAKRTKEYIEVGSEEEADILSREYKEAVPKFLERDEPGGGGPGSSSFQLAPTQEQKEQINKNKIKLGLMSKPKPKAKNGK